MSAFVIGNGESRSNIVLTDLDGMTYGCNALYRTFTPDVLVATDDPISRSIQSSGYARNNTFYTRKTYHGTGAKKLRPPFSKWGSGPNALHLAVYDKHTDITLIGFDLGSVHRTHNNMYAGTEFYTGIDQVPYSHTNWTHQIQTIMQMAPNVQFTIAIGRETCNIVQCLGVLENVKIITIQEFINNNMEITI